MKAIDDTKRINILEPNHGDMYEKVNLMSHIVMYKKARPYPSYHPDPCLLDDDAYEFISLVCRTRRKTCKYTRIMHKE